MYYKAQDFLVGYCSAILLSLLSKFILQIQDARANIEVYPPLSENIRLTSTPVKVSSSFINLCIMTFQRTETKIRKFEN